MVLRAFTHEFNEREVAAQEYRLAKEHFDEVLRLRDPTNREHEKRFRDAAERRSVARDRFVAALCR